MFLDWPCASVPPARFSSRRVVGSGQIRQTVRLSVGGTRLNLAGCGPNLGRVRPYVRFGRFTQNSTNMLADLSSKWKLWADVSQNSAGVGRCLQRGQRRRMLADACIFAPISAELGQIWTDVCPTWANFVRFGPNSACRLQTLSRKISAICSVHPPFLQRPARCVS